MIFLQVRRDARQEGVHAELVGRNGQRERSPHCDRHCALDAVQVPVAGEGRQLSEQFAAKERGGATPWSHHADIWPTNAD